MRLTPVPSCPCSILHQLTSLLGPPRITWRFLHGLQEELEKRLQQQLHDSDTASHAMQREMPCDAA